MKKILILLSLIMITVISVPSSLAYFYTYTRTQGEFTLTLNDKTVIDEEFDNKEKVVTISADDNSDAIFVRAKAFTTSNIEIKYNLGTNWSDGGDGYYYYALPIDGKTSSENIAKDADPFKVSIEFPVTAEDGDQHNVVVIYEATPALFKTTDPGNVRSKWFDSVKNGYWYANWETIIVEGGE